MKAISDERLAKLPDLLEQAERRVNAYVFCTGGDDSLASIPANRDRDVDLLLMEAAAALRELAQLRQAGKQEASHPIPADKGDTVEISREDARLCANALDQYARQHYDREYADICREALKRLEVAQGKEALSEKVCGTCGGGGVISWDDSHGEPCGADCPACTTADGGEQK